MCLTKRFQNKQAGKKQAELLELMANEPHIRPKELSAIRSKALVIAGNKDMIKGSHTRLIASSLPNSQLAIIQGDHFTAAKNPRCLTVWSIDF